MYQYILIDVCVVWACMCFVFCSRGLLAQDDGLGQGFGGCGRALWLCLRCASLSCPLRCASFGCLGSPAFSSRHPEPVTTCAGLWCQRSSQLPSDWRSLTFACRICALGNLLIVYDLQCSAESQAWLVTKMYPFVTIVVPTGDLCLLSIGSATASGIAESFLSVLANVQDPSQYFESMQTTATQLQKHRSELRQVGSQEPVQDDCSRNSLSAS